MGVIAAVSVGVIVMLSSLAERVVDLSAFRPSATAIVSD